MIDVKKVTTYRLSSPESGYDLELDEAQLLKLRDRLNILFPSSPSGGQTNDLDPGSFVTLAMAGKKLEAIKEVRTLTTAGLKEAKDAVYLLDQAMRFGKSASAVDLAMALVREAGKAGTPF